MDNFRIVSWDGIFLVELDPKTGLRREPAAPPICLATAPEIEAPFLHKHADKYYLFVNWGKCCRGTNSTYEIRVGRSETITGPSRPLGPGYARTRRHAGFAERRRISRAGPRFASPTPRPGMAGAPLLRPIVARPVTPALGAGEVGPSRLAYGGAVGKSPRFLVLWQGRRSGGCPKTRLSNLRRSHPSPRPSPR